MSGRTGGGGTVRPTDMIGPLGRTGGCMQALAFDFFCSSGSGTPTACPFTVIDRGSTRRIHLIE